MLDKIKNLWENVSGTTSRLFSEHRELWLIPAILLLALGLARVTALLSFRLISPVSAQNSRMVSTSVTPRKSLPQLDISSFFSGPLFKGNPVGEVQMAEAQEVSSEPDVQFTLLGTLEGHPSFARAIVNIEGEGSNREFGVRQKIGHSRILSIRRNYIWIIKNGTKYKIEVGKKSGEAVKAIAAIAPRSGKKVVKVISREEVNQKILGNPNAIYKGARFGPLLQNDKIVGYKLYAVEPSHVFYSLGARSGDVVKSVNGYPLGDTNRMFELWKAVPNMDKIDVVIDRGGNPYNYEFHIRN